LWSENKVEMYKSDIARKEYSIITQRPMLILVFWKKTIKTNKGKISI